MVYFLTNAIDVYMNEIDNMVATLYSSMPCVKYGNTKKFTGR